MVQPFRFSLRALGLTVTVCAVVFGIATWRFGGTLIAAIGMMAFGIASRRALGLARVHPSNGRSSRAWGWLGISVLLAVFGVAVQANGIEQIAQADPIFVVGLVILVIGITSVVLT